MPARQHRILLMAGGLSKVKHLFLLLLTILVFCSCGSYLNIEKRIYRDGFHVEQNIFSQSDERKHGQYKVARDRTSESHKIFSSEFSANSLASFSANNDGFENILMEDYQKMPRKIVFNEDTLKKKKLKKKDDVLKFDQKKDITNKDRKTNPFAIAGLVISILAILIPAIAIISLILSLIALWQIKMRPEKYEGRVLAIIGLVVSIFWIGIGLYIY